VHRHRPGSRRPALTIPERARLQLARAILDNPALLVCDPFNAELDNDAQDTMSRLLEHYPAVVILASDNPEQIITATHTWRPDGAHRITPRSRVRRRGKPPDHPASDSAVTQRNSQVPTGSVSELPIRQGSGTLRRTTKRTRQIGCSESGPNRRRRRWQVRLSSRGNR